MNVGDKVRITDHTFVTYGKIGVITNDEPYFRYDYTVSVDGYEFVVRESEIEFQTNPELWV